MQDDPFGASIALLRIICNCIAGGPLAAPAHARGNASPRNGLAGTGPFGRRRILLDRIHPMARCSVPATSISGCLRVSAWAAAASIMAPGAALAAEGAQKGPSEVVFLAQLITLMLVGRLLGEAMNRIGQPSVMGMLLGGILLGPSLFGALWPDLQHALFPKTPE